MATPKQVQRRGRLSLVLGTVFAALTFAALRPQTVVETLDADSTRSCRDNVADPVRATAGQTKTCYVDQDRMHRCRGSNGRFRNGSCRAPTVA